MALPTISITDEDSTEHLFISLRMELLDQTRRVEVIERKGIKGSLLRRDVEKSRPRTLIAIVDVTEANLTSKRQAMLGLVGQIVTTKRDSGTTDTNVAILEADVLGEPQIIESVVGGVNADSDRLMTFRFLAMLTDIS